MTGSIPATFKKLVVKQRTKNFREAVTLAEGHLPESVPAGEVYVKVAYAGVNATDVNFTMGSYVGKDTPLPFDCGLEGLGTVVKIGDGVHHLAPGDAVVFIKYGAYAEYVSVPAATCLKVPSVRPEFLVLLISGLTAAIAIGELGAPKKGEVALVTAAAGGTGQVAVQLLKHVYGCTVIGTCSSPAKAAFLKSLGCDHVINYKTENLDEKLTEYAPNGVNVVYECVGGATFHTAVTHTATLGRVILIGAISTYLEPNPNAPQLGSIFTYLNLHSVSIRGFLLLHFRSHFQHYFDQLLQAVNEGKLKLNVDEHVFQGVESTMDAVDHLYSSTSMGKVIVRM